LDRRRDAVLRRTRSGIFIPTGASAQPPKFVCTLCKAGFRDTEYRAFERHVKKCSDAREAEIHAMSPRTRAPGIFGDQGWDTEREQWVRDNREALLEDRKRQ
jgi:hypothetical protein